jgi:SAM-dependent methyltransferase
VETNRQAWNRHARRYFEEGSHSYDVVDYCSLDYPTEAELQLIGPVNGLHVLELGSGACNCGVALARQGAKVTCLDLSSEQLAIGREQAARLGVSLDFIEGSMDDLSGLLDSAFDLVLSVCALHYGSDLHRIFSEVARVLKEGGRFIFSVDHPVMLALGAAELWPEENGDPHYDYRGPVRWKWRPENEFEFVTFRRPVADYLNGLVAAGFILERFLELCPKPDPNWSERERVLRTRFPSLLIIKARKATDE